MVMKFDKQLFRNEMNKFLDKNVVQDVSCDSVEEIIEQVNIFIKHYDFDSCIYEEE